MPTKYRPKKIAGYTYNPRMSMAAKQQKAYRRIGLIVIAVAAITYGIIRYAGDLVGTIGSVGKKESSEEIKQDPLQGQLPLTPPEIDPIPAYTNQRKINITGRALQGDKIILFFQGKEIASDTIKEDRKFEFTELNLMTGSNVIVVKAVTNSGSGSATSQEVKTELDQKPPTLEVTEPKNGDKIAHDNARFTVKGKTEADAKMYINDHIVILSNDGSFEYLLTLKDGENVITAKAIDQAGNEIKQEIKVTLQPAS